jgi:crossover junction endodeoxyribonuclease RuvC
MRVLGIDPGSRITGFGIVEAEAGALRHVDSGQIRLSDYELAQRLRIIYRRLEAVIVEHRPQVMAVEKVFLARNPQSALVLGQARGAAIVAGAIHDLEVAEYTALQVKQSVVGKGKAAKQQVQHMVRVLLGLRGEPPTDCADALACAICHLNHSHGRARWLQGLSTAGARL